MKQFAITVAGATAAAVLGAVAVSLLKKYEVIDD